MTTIPQTLDARQDQPRQTNVIFTALAAVALMVSAAAAGAGFVVYHEFAGAPDDTRSAAFHAPSLQSLDLSAAPARLSTAEMTPTFRPVAAGTSDQSDYRHADNTVLAPAAARRVIAAWVSNPLLPKVPAPLAKEQSAPAVSSPSAAIGLAQARSAQSAVVNIQTPPREVRVASAVQIRAAILVDPTADDLQPDSAVMSDEQGVPIRRAQAVTSGHRFDASSYLASQDAEPVLTAEPVNPTSRAAGYRHDFRLP